MRIFVYECITAGGMGSNVPASLRREGQAMLDAVVADFRHIAGIEVVTLTDSFRAHTKSADWTLVIAPEFDNLLASLAQDVLNAGGRLLGSSPGAIQRTADKWQLADYWHRHDVPHPVTRIHASDLTTPFILKPRFGAGSQATFRIDQSSDWATCQSAAKDEWPNGDFILQSYVPGQPASVALLIGPAQTIALAPARQHLSRDGRFRYEGGSLPLPIPLAERATKLALQAIAGIDGLLGYVGVDLVLGDDGRDYVIEINPRLTTSYIGLRQLCDGNLAELMLRVVQGRETKTPACKAGEVHFEADGTIRR